MDASASIYQSDITPRWQSSKRAAGGRVCRLLAGAARPLVRCPRSAETDEPMDGRRAAAPDRQWLGTRCEIVRRVPATSAHLQHLRRGPDRPCQRPKLTNRWTVDERRRQVGSGWAQGAKSYGVSQQRVPICSTCVQGPGRPCQRPKLTNRWTVDERRRQVATQLVAPFRIAPNPLRPTQLAPFRGEAVGSGGSGRRTCWRTSRE